jgi:hypothetical protein
MMTKLTKFFKYTSLTILFCGVVLILDPGSALAWTSARLASVDVTVEMAPSGPSTVITQARFVVSGGEFHGFDLVDLPGMELVPEESKAARDDGRLHNLAFRHFRDGRTRVVLAGKEKVQRGGISFALVHRIDFTDVHALRLYEGRARFNWTPFVWDEGLDVMRVHIVLPGKSRDASINVDSAVSRDYEVEIGADKVELTKFRPVRWYQMQMAVDFDPALVSNLSVPEKEEPAAVPAAVVGGRNPPLPPGPRYTAVFPALAVLLGLIALFAKRLHLYRVSKQLGMVSHFQFFPATALSVRIFLTLAALSLGLAAQYMGCLAAGVPALVATAALWMSRRQATVLRLRPGGIWRQMDDEDLTRYRRLARGYRRSRKSLVDITIVRGVVSFLCLLAGIGYVAFWIRESSPQIAWAVVLDGLILAIPAWFSNVRSELPVDPALEGFWTLRKWRKALSRLVGTNKQDAVSLFWVREDKQGPVEVRLRVQPPPEGLNGIEVAGEVLLSGSVYKTRTAVILRTEPGTEAARQLAKCPHAVEHHLTPDLEEEIIVLRDRRGRTTGLSPLRTALAQLQTSSG